MVFMWETRINGFWVLLITRNATLVLSKEEDILDSDSTLAFLVRRAEYMWDIYYC